MTLAVSPAANPVVTDTPRVFRLLLVDTHRIFRHALRVLLAPEPGFAVVGESGGADEALELVAALHPDVVITDLHLGDGPGVELIARIRARFPGVAVLVLTAARARDAAASAKRAGALGYLLKDRGRSELLAALRAVTAGRCYRSSTAATRAELRADPRALTNRAAYLTERQRQVLRSVARGHPTREIAQMLGVSVRAVHKQRERLRSVLQLNSTAALTRFALREGFAEETPALR
jgi:DNA-binding NarL/FixJ family response regulator